MKLMLKRITIAIMLLLLVYSLAACNSSNVEQMDVTVMVLNNSYDKFEAEREFSSDEAIFLIKDIPQDKILTDGDYKYILSTNEEYAAIIEYSGKKKTIKIPSEVNDVPVVCVTGWQEQISERASTTNALCSDRQLVEKIVLPNTIVTIGPETFSHFEKLQEIVFSTSLTHIYDRAFNDCSSIKELELPNSLKSISYLAFSGCTSLEVLSIPEGLEHIGTNSFDGCVALEEITLPKSLIYVSEGSFSNCTELNTIHLSHNTVLHEDFYRDSWDTESIIPELLYYDEEKKSDADIVVVPEISEPKYIEDLEGYTLRIFDIGSVDDRYYSMFKDDNFKKVVETVSELYNCSIIEVTSDDYYNDLKKAAMLGESFCDIAILPSDIVLDCVSNSIITPWQPTQNVDLSADWWDQSANKRYNLNGVQLAVSGDFNINNFASQICYVYNREKLDKNTYEFGGIDPSIYTYSSMLISDANSGDFGKDGDFSVKWSDSYKFNWDYYTYNGGICGSTFDYYRTMLAGQGIDFYNFSEDSKLSLSYGTGRGYIGRMEGMSKDSELSEYRSDMNSVWVPIKELALKNLELSLMNESIGSIDMSSFKACDESLFTNGTSTFKIVRLDEVPALMETGMDIGIVTLPGGIYTSLVDTPTLAVQPICTGDEYKNLVILDAIAKYSSSEMLPDFMKSFIGDKPENDDRESTYSYNEQMLNRIYENPYYEFDIGSTGDAIQYLYYKYMLRYDASDLWRQGKISNKKFESSLGLQMMYLNNISYALEFYLEDHPAAEPVTPAPKETWADEYYNLFSNNDDSYILNHVLDISKITSLCNSNGEGYLSDLNVLGDIILAYKTFSKIEPTTDNFYTSYENFYLTSSLSKDENVILERFFYDNNANVRRYQLSYVQDALDYLYGDGVFNAEHLSNETWCYITEDNQYLYLQEPYIRSNSGRVYYRLVDTKYIEDAAIIYMNVINSSYDDGYTVWNDYVNHIVLAKDEGSVSYSGNGVFNRITSENITLEDLGIMKLFLTQDSTGIHIKGVELPK